MADQVEFVDITSLNAVAAGTNKTQRRIVASGIGGKLMGTSEMVKVTAEEITKTNEDDLKNNAGSQRSKVIHSSEKPWSLSTFVEKINWLHMVLVVGLPMYGLFEMTRIAWNPKTLVLAFVLYVFSGLSITAGYHRLWAHKAYDAALPVRLFWAFFGAGAVEGLVKWWGHSHRVHHRYTDTARDPYDARQGFWFSHMGWMLTMANPKNKARADIADLLADPVVVYQHKYYMYVMLLSAFILPTLIAGFGWGDWMGGFIIAGLFKSFVIQQATFCVNSLAHWIGVQPFDDRRSPRDHALTALVTFGEGYHNFHHEFPSDYRNALKWWQYDPTKVVIWTLSKLGLAYNLKTFSQNAIEQGLVQQQQKKLDRMKAKLQWGADLSKLPVWDREEFNARAKDEGLLIIGGVIHKVGPFIKEHPGGQALVRASIGKDATKAFSGGVYYHSNAAHNLLQTMRVGVIRDAKLTADTFRAQNEMEAKEKSG